MARIVLLLLACLLTAQADTDALLREADQHAALGRWNEARAAYQRALAEGADLKSDYSRARNLGAAAFYSSPPDLGLAGQWLEAALKLHPAADDTRLLLAQCLVRSGNLQPAIEQYRTLVKSNPDSPEYALGLAQTLHFSGAPEAATAPLSAFLQRNPRNNPVRLELARMLGFARRYPEATVEYQRVLESEPDNVAALVGVAKVASWQKRLNEALVLFDQVLARHPTLYDAHVGKAFTLMWAGRYYEARQIFTRMAATRPSDVEVAEALRELGGPVVETPAAPAAAQPAPQPVTAVPANEPAKAAPQPAQTNPSAPVKKPSKPRAVSTPEPPAETQRAKVAAAAQSEAPEPPAQKHSPLAVWGAPVLIVLAGGALAYQANRVRRGKPLPFLRTRYHLPASTLEARPQQPAAVVTPATAETPLWGRVLLAHPEPQAQEHARTVLAGAGAEVETVAAGDEAVARLRGARYDAVIAHEQLANGWSAADLCKWVRLNQPVMAPKVMVVAESGSAPEAEYNGALCLGAPYSASDLVAMTRLALGRASRMAS